MKRFSKILIGILLVGGFAFGAYKYHDAVNARLGSAFDRVTAILGPTPCAESIPYNIGTFATQFGISQAYFLSALTDAEAIWEKPLGKDLFTYAPADTDRNVLKINLIYDYRQQATSKLAKLGITVQDNKASYDQLKAKFLAEKDEFQQEENDFNARVESFNEKSAAYELEVERWNAQGGAPEEEFNHMEEERKSLQQESADLKTTQNQLNAKADEVNALVTVVNQLATKLNLAVESYNNVSVARGESFDEGVYTRDNTGQYIDIYEFSSRDKLVRVLAHELGHALGLEHVDDPKAIMYAYNEGNSQALTAADLAAVKKECGIK